MKRFLQVQAFLLISIAAAAQPFTAFISRAWEIPEYRRQEAVDRYMGGQASLPLLEADSACSFVYQGQAASVSVAGDFTGWRAGIILMKNLTGTTLWYATSHFEPDARLDYKIVVNDTAWILDPGNSHTCKSGYGINSELRMPRYMVPPETVPDPTVPAGTILDTIYRSSRMDNEREVKIYLPAGYPAAGTAYPVILFHDGIEFLSLGNAATILDNMIARKQIRPVIALFIAPVQRDEEYSGTLRDDYSFFLASELMPSVDNRFATSKDPALRAELGISNGGNIALYSGMNNPECFGKIAALSSNIIPEISDRFNQEPKPDLEIYLDIGTYDIDVLIPMADSFAGILEDKGYDFHFYRWHDGHSWGNWKDHLGVVLKQFFPY